MDLNAFAGEIHSAHLFGFANNFSDVYLSWDRARWSYYKKKPMTWYCCDEYYVPRGKDSRCLCYGCTDMKCAGRDCLEPRGIAPYLCDGLMRILDLAGAFGIEINCGLPVNKARRRRMAGYSASQLVGMLCVATAELSRAKVKGMGNNIMQIADDISTWLNANGVDMNRVMKERYRWLDMNAWRYEQGEWYEQQSGGTERGLCRADIKSLVGVDL